MKKHIIKLNDKKMLIAYLKEDLSFSSRRAKKYLKDGLLKLNDKKAYGDTLLKDGDVLLIENKLEKDWIKPQYMDLTILYEDDYFLALDKSPYMLVHPSKNNNKDTLANGLRYYFDKKGIYEPIRFFNRLDMNTSGIVIVPKTSHFHSLLDRFSSKTIIKRYYAFVKGVPQLASGFIDKPISILPDTKGRRTIDFKGKRAITAYKTLEDYGMASLIDLELKTGRTHQIRVHLNSIGHPIFGDELYDGSINALNRQALHAYLLELDHPVYKRRITIDSPLPSDLKQFKNKLRGVRSIEEI